MDILIREANIEDARTITRLAAQLGYDLPRHTIISNIQSIHESPDNISYVAIIDNEVVGWMHVFYTVRIESMPFCEIAGLVVDEEYRGKGIGKLLVDRANAWCALKQCTKLKVRSNVTRKEAHKFYEMLGFTKVKKQAIFEREV